jgi:hypothetical protein
VAAAATAASNATAAPLVLLVEAGALALLAFGLVRAWGQGIGWGLVLSVLAYLLALAAEPRELDPAAPAVGVSLFLAAELAYWSVELRPPARQAPDLPLRRLATVVAVALAAEVLAGTALLGAAPGRTASLLLDAAGVLAAVAAVALLVGLPARRRPGGGVASGGGQGD